MKALYNNYSILFNYNYLFIDLVSVMLLCWSSVVKTYICHQVYFRSIFHMFSTLLTKKKSLKSYLILLSTYIPPFRNPIWFQYYIHPCLIEFDCQSLLFLLVRKTARSCVHVALLFLCSIHVFLFCFLLFVWSHQLICREFSARNCNS